MHGKDAGSQLVYINIIVVPYLPSVSTILVAHIFSEVVCVDEAFFVGMTGHSTSYRRMWSESGSWGLG